MLKREFKISPRRGIALVNAVVCTAIFMGVIIGWYATQKGFRQFTISESDKRFLSQKAIAAAEIARDRILRHIQTRVTTANPSSPQTITTLTAQQINYPLADSEAISIRCLGQGRFRYGQTGGTLAACTDSSTVYPKIFSIDISVRNSDKSTVATLNQTVEVAPMGVNRFAYLVTGSTSPEIVFAGGDYQGMVGAFFAEPTPATLIRFINPPSSELNFRQTFVSNVPTENIVKGIDMGWAGMSATGPSNFQQGFLQLHQTPDVVADFNSFQSNPNYTIIRSNRVEGSRPELVKVQIGSTTSAANRCKIQIIESFPATCLSQSEAASLLADRCPETFGNTDVSTLDKVYQDKITACENFFTSTLSQTVNFNGLNFELWDKDAPTALDWTYVKAKCGMTDADVDAITKGNGGKALMSTEDCLNLVKADGYEVGYDTGGELVVCNPSGSNTNTYPGPLPVDIVDGSIFEVSGRAIEIEAIGGASGGHATICNNFTIYVPDSSPVSLNSSVLRTCSTCDTDIKSVDFAPSDTSKANAAILMPGSISIKGSTRSLLSGQTLSQLKALNTPAASTSLAIEMNLVSTDSPALNVDNSLTNSSLPGTIGTLEVLGGLIGADQSITRTITMYNGAAQVSGFAAVNLTFNQGNLIRPAPILGDSQASFPLQLTITSYQIDFTSVAEALAMLRSSNVQQAPTFNPKTNPKTDPAAPSQTQTETQQAPAGLGVE